MIHHRQRAAANSGMTCYLVCIVDKGGEEAKRMLCNAKHAHACMLHCLMIGLDHAYMLL